MEAALPLLLLNQPVKMDHPLGTSSLGVLTPSCSEINSRSKSMFFCLAIIKATVFVLFFV